MKRVTTLLIACCLWLLAAASTCIAQMYTVTDLGTLEQGKPEPTYSLATAINTSGQVVGVSSRGYQNRSFRTAPNSPINPDTDDLGNLLVPSSFSDNTAYGINDSGQAVGLSGMHAFRTAPNSPINPDTDDLGILMPVAWISNADGINASGQVVGWFNGMAFRTAPNSPINPETDALGTLGGTWSYGYGINAFGQVVGYASTNGDAAYHAFRTAPNSPINPATDDLGTLGGTSSFAYGINGSGQVVGYASTPGDAAAHAFLYSGGVMYDLNNLIPADSGWELQSSLSINDVGQIAGHGYHNGNLRAFLLTPALTVSPRIIDFGTVYLKRVVVRTVTLKNAGTVAAPIGRISLTIPSGDLDEFIFLRFCGKSLAAGKSCTIMVFLYADDVATDTATLNIETNPPSNPLQVPIMAVVVKRQ